MSVTTTYPCMQCNRDRGHPHASCITCLTAVSGYPDDNPKTAVGATKIPLHLVPPSAKHVLAEAMADGAKKYGPFNWRTKRVSTTTYVAASMRHIEAYLDGEDVAPDSLVHHVGHAMACMAILYDAMTIGMLNDDRPTKGAAPRLQVEYAARHAKAAEPTMQERIAEGMRRVDEAMHRHEVEAHQALIDATLAAHGRTPNYPRTDTGD